MGNNNSEEHKEKESSKTVFFRIALLGVLTIATIVLLNGNGHVPEGGQEGQESHDIQNANPFEGLFLEAKAAYVYDIAEDRVYFTKNETAQLPLASLTKVMTALVASELISDNTPITLTEESVAIEGDSGLKPGERWTFRKLLDYTLLVSSNDGAHAIAGVAGAFVLAEDENSNPHARFIARMNQKAHELGLTQSFFINESGLDVSTAVSGGYGSAKDMGTLTAFTVKRPEILEATSYSALHFISEDAFTYGATNTNAAIGKIPGIIASKTGFTDLAGGNIVVVFNAGINHPVVAVVLGSSYEGRFNDIEKLVRASLKRIAQ
ncbi:D-alanyl-D-alanine carboxypeptidase [Candidatus Kaiserbacteria bacterium]|nr:D-alanyl-D-alanine carboxypeptidase [Candidatus Kaiserbacteria bacterium]